MTDAMCALPMDALMEILVRCERPGDLLLSIRGAASWIDDRIVHRWAVARFGGPAKAVRRACEVGRERTLLAVLALSKGPLAESCYCVDSIDMARVRGKLYLKDKKDCRCEKSFLEKCLFNAVEWGRCTPAMAKALIVRGADVNCGRLFLHRACAACDIGTVRVFLGAGASIRAKDNYGQMPHEVAKKMQRSDVVKLFKRS